ncbi:hypothetical protein PR048_027382 [Dryococelus australis]|uniref:Nuclear speckle splicing regulatory protein 1 N-terminal domain-containing protein n=1 Tax=Dryococelus australis TaxID=614101 RepID=A0ABQ9GGH1_9NEOP|nr:hypothetical protein PR048_027382 [Dryococelus australis]
MSGSSKTYGLLAPKKGPLQPRHAVFGDDSGDEASEAPRSHPVRKSKTAVTELDGALLQYDDYHDELQRERAEQQKARREAAQARYIPMLLQQAERRKKEAERRTERLVQKEREAEGDQFLDKETFVTASYRKKVEEFAKMDVEDRRQEQLEELCNVTKQKDLSAFYGSLYKQTVNTDDKVKVEVDDDEAKSNKIKDGKIAGKKSRHYRKRKNSSSSEQHSDGTNEISKECATTQERKTRDGSEMKQTQQPPKQRSDEHPRSSSKRKRSHEAGKSQGEEDLRSPRRDTNHVGGGDAETVSEKCVESGSEEGEIREEEEERDAKSAESTTKVEVPVVEKEGPVEDVVVPQVEKVDIWAKHTVGEVFEAAVQRYWQRKAARDAAGSVARQVCLVSQ